MDLKKGEFYLGKKTGGEDAPEEPLIYDSADLTTHGVIVGMTGHIPTLRRALDGIGQSENATHLPAAIALDAADLVEERAQDPRVGIAHAGEDI